MERHSRGQVFTHTDDDGTVRRFSIPLLRESMRAEPDAWELTEAPLNQEMINMILELRGIAEARIRFYPADKLHDAGIGCGFPDGSVLTVDGNHRAVARFRAGLLTMTWNICGPDVWQRCLLSAAEMAQLGTVQFA